MQKGSKKWHDTIQSWVVQGKRADREVLVVYYEDLKRDTKTHTKDMLNFLGIDVMKTVGESFAKFHRKHNSSEEQFDPFTGEQRKLVMSIIQETIREIETNGLTSQINLSRYL